MTCCKKGENYNFEKGGKNKYHFRTKTIDPCVEIIHESCFNFIRTLGVCFY
jgi:hypothetical protein